MYHQNHLIFMNVIIAGVTLEFEMEDGSTEITELEGSEISEVARIVAKGLNQRNPLINGEPAKFIAQEYD